MKPLYLFSKNTLQYIVLNHNEEFSSKKKNGGKEGREWEREGMYRFVLKGHKTKIHFQRESFTLEAKLKIALGGPSSYFFL